MLSALVNHFLSTDADRRLAHTGLEKADFIYGVSGNRGTAGRIVKEAEDRGLDIANLTFSDIESEEELHNIGEKIEGKKLFYRHKAFSNADSVEEKIDLLEDLNVLEQEYDVELVNNPLAAIAHDSKTVGKRLIDENLSIGIARTTEQYSESGAKEKVKDRPVVLKPDDGTCGDGVIKAKSVDEIDNYLEGKDEEIVFEEYIPHDLDLSERPANLDEEVYEGILNQYGENIVDGRAYVADREVIADTARKNDEGLATNLAKGGDYTKPEELDERQEESLVRATTGLDFAAVDYVQTDDELIIYEVNATPGTDYEDKVGGIIEPVVDMLDPCKQTEEFNEITAEIRASLESNNSNQYSAAV